MVKKYVIVVLCMTSVIIPSTEKALGEAGVNRQKSEDKTLSENEVALVSYEYTEVDDLYEQIEITVSSSAYRTNAYELNLKYDPKKHQAVSIVPSEEMCEYRFLISRTINPNEGTIYIACGSILPPNQNDDMRLATVYFRKINESKPELNLIKEKSALYKHDGLGTRVQLADRV